MKKPINILLALLIAISTLSLNSISHAQKMDSWAKDSYENLIKKNIIPEILKNKDLTEKINRLEFTHLLITYLLSNKNFQINTEHRKYPDIDDSFVNLALNLDIVTGYNDGTFKAHNYITRSEAAVIAHNIEILLGTAKEGSIDEFKDYKFIPNWAVKSVGSMLATGAMSGYPNKNFSPSKNISRQEAIVMVDKLLSGKSGELLDAFNISKNDEYLTKLQYDFVLSNIPMSKYSIDNVKKKIFLTSNDRRMEIFQAYNKTVPFSNNNILTSPNLIFDDGTSSYVVGLEIRNTLSGKKDQRTFMTETKYNDKKIILESKREYGSWYTIYD